MQGEQATYLFAKEDGKHLSAVFSFRGSLHTPCLRGARAQTLALRVDS